MKRILLVDDDPIANFLNKSIVEECMDCQVEEAQNGKEAIQFIEESLENQNYPDLILLDLNMPVMDGHQFLSELENMPVKSKIKVVILSSSRAAVDVEKVGNKAKGYLSKPLTEEKFQKVLEILNS